VRVLALLLRLGAKFAAGLSFLVVLARRAATINFHSEVVPAPPSAALNHPHKVHCGQPRTRVKIYPAIRDLDPSNRTARSNPARAVVPSSETHSKASRAPLITLPYYQDHLPGHLYRRTHRATRPLPFYPSRALLHVRCASRRKTGSFRLPYLPNRS
jgi:hypothetical protein